MNIKYKTIKLVVINMLTLIVGIGLMSGSVSQRNALASRYETIPPIRLQALGNYQGQYLSLIYAVGSKPFISTENSQISLSIVKDSKTLVINSDKIDFSAVNVEKEGFRPSYNMVIAVISPKPAFSWVNSDGSIPQGAMSSDNHRISKMQIINKSDIDDFTTANGLDSTLTINLIE